jgi:uncharacterized protein
VSSSGQIEFAPIDLVVLQGTPLCNLNCSYCYLTEASRRTKATMDLSSVRKIFSKIFASRFVGDRLHVSWHSGEPTVLSPSYYDAAIEAILDLKAQHSSPDLPLRFDIQTNGTLINPKWCDFFKARREVLSVGVSCDGPAFLHDAGRKTWLAKPTHKQTVRGMNLLVENGITFDVTAVVSEPSLDHPQQFFEFFSSYASHIREFHFNLCDEFGIASEDIAARDVLADRYRHFLRWLLEALKNVGCSERIIRIRNLTDFYERLFAPADSAKVHDARSASRPFRSVSVDTNGNISTFYAGLTLHDSADLYGDKRGLIVGNLLEQDLEEIAGSDKLRRIAQDFESSHQACQAACDYWSLCSGGFNLIKHKRFGTFEATETTECHIHVKTFVDALLEDMNRSARGGDV